MAGQDRREFLKLSCLTGLGAVTLGVAGQSKTTSAEVELTLDVWRVRPGGEVPVVLRASRALDVHLVALDDNGVPGRRHWGPVPLRPVSPGVYEGSLPAPDADLPLYRLVAVAATDRVVVSNAVEVICARFHVGA